MGALETHAKNHYSRYAGALQRPFCPRGRFRGIHLGELSLVKQIFERNVTVYAKVAKRGFKTVALPGPLPGVSDLPPCKAFPGVGGGSLLDASTTQLLTFDNDNDDDDDDNNNIDDDDDETVAVCVRQSLGRYPCTRYVGLYENHFFT